jgi:hypothetical protein
MVGYHITVMVPCFKYLVGIPDFYSRIPYFAFEGRRDCGQLLLIN